MIKLVGVLYIACFGIYILFSRQPDWFDSEMVPAVVVEKTGKLMARYIVLADTAYAPAEYIFRPLKVGERVEVIYEVSQPQYATLYTVWGYWIKWTEVLASLLLTYGFYYAAIAITARPTPESLLEQMAEDDSPKPKYKP